MCKDCTTHTADDMDGGVAAALIEKEAEPTDVWRRRAEKAEDRADDAHNLIVALRADLAATEARAEQAERMAALWKEVARRAVQDQSGLRFELSLTDARAEDAETMRDEARDGLTRLARALDVPDTATTGDMIARIEEINCHDCIRDAAVIRESRPVTPDAITDEMVERARAEAGAWDHQMSGVGMRYILTAALTEPPKRPEGAEDIEQMVGAWDEGEGGMASLGPEDRQELADFLASRGVRVTEDGAR